QEKIIKRPNNQLMIRAIEENNFPDIIGNVENVLEPITMELYPQLIGFKSLLEDLALEKVFMTGSGPTFVGIASDREKAAFAVDKLNNKIPWVKLAKTTTSHYI